MITLDVKMYMYLYMRDELMLFVSVYLIWGGSILILTELFLMIGWNREI